MAALHNHRIAARKDLHRGWQKWQESGKGKNEYSRRADRVRRSRARRGG
jgi:hypothetical protein